MGCIRPPGPCLLYRQPAGGVGVSHHFMTTDVKATRLLSFSLEDCGFLGGQEWWWRILKQDVTLHISSEVLKESVHTGDSWSVQCFSLAGETWSVPAAFLFPKSLFTLCDRESGGGRNRGSWMRCQSPCCGWGGCTREGVRPAPVPLKAEAVMVIQLNLSFSLIVEREGPLD